ncbi:acyl-CoA dehydrogenase family protein [Rhabdothermincola sp.]|uniref:acyl-CoA dehydrogenase family protein n=1 Tax=Rhabdothermincola sp. TaxID=2820405 RepID=UPI002FE2CF74
MDFELSADQLALRDAARELLAGYASPTQVRAVVDAGGGFDPKLWAAMVEQGWTAIALPESCGGLGLGFVEVAVLLEQVGAHVAPAPVLQQIVALTMLADAAPEWVEPLVRGASIATIAWSPVRAEPTGEGWVLAGRTEPAVYAPSADVAVVRSEDAVFAVDLRAGGRPAAEPAMDRTREVGWLVFDGTPAVRLGGVDALERFCDLGATAYSAELLGLASRSLELAVAYAKDREQFGRPIGSFQAVKHRCADMLVDVEGMRSSAYWAAWCVAADDPDRSIAASTAKTWCSDAARRVTASALQVHGGIGFTWESDVHLFLKRSQLDERAFGDAVFHRARLASMLRARVEAGESVI